MISSIGIFTRFTVSFFCNTSVVVFILRYNDTTTAAAATATGCQQSAFYLFRLLSYLLILGVHNKFYSSRTKIFHDNNNNNNNNSHGCDNDIRILSLLSSLVFTPLNALRYISHVSNLKDHRLGCKYVFPVWAVDNQNHYLNFNFIIITHSFHPDNHKRQHKQVNQKRPCT
jgi:hypothetical protein